MRRLTTSDNAVKEFLFKDISIEVVDEKARNEIDSLSPVAKSGSYSDLTDTPPLARVATTGDYNDLIDKPALKAVATSGSYNDLSDTPNLATVATTGDYDDLIDKPALKAVATSGSYNDLTDKPSIPVVNDATLTIQKNGVTVQTFTANQNTNATANIALTKADVGLENVGNFKAVSTVANQGLTDNEKGNARANIGAGSSSFSGDYNDLSNKPDLKTVATTGSYNDLTNKPTIPTVNNATLTIQKNGTTIKTFTANASSNVTCNITVPTKTSELTNDRGYITDAGVTGVKGNSETTYRTGNVNITKSNIGLGSVGNFKAVSTVASQELTDTEKSNARANIGAGTSSFSGSYNDLTNKPTIPTVNNATLTIQKNGTNVQTFTANQSTNATANITMSKSDVGLGNVGNFKAVSTVASQGLTDTEKSNARANIGAGTSSFSGSYNDLTNKPTIPTVNNAKLTIQKNGTTVKTFTSNASSNVTCNITVPTNNNELTNGAGYITSSGTASNVSGTVAIAHGGTGATTYDSARSNLGVGTNKITSATALAVGTHTLSSDGYIICEAGEFTQFYGQIYGSNQQSGTGMNINARSRLFVRKGMKVVVNTANVIYWLPLS